MKLRSLSFDGFRGALNPVHVDFGDAFTVITGRNGSGKSTIVDAIEYALTGTLERFQFDTEKGEHIEDYLWWRGSGSPKRRVVNLVLVDDSGRDISISRGPDGTSDREDLQGLLIDPSAAPDFALPRLCQTAIIRDETITRLSTDMGETERFDFVNRIMGLSRIDIESRLSATSKRLREMSIDRQADYARTKDEVNRITSDLSQARLAASGSSGADLTTVIASLSEALGLTARGVSLDS
jgi:chromosome segregation protein